MEEELMLKQKYNDLLQSLRKGEEYIKSNPEDEKAQKRLTELANEMQNIMKAIPNMTQEEMENGFKIEVPIKQKAESINITIPTEVISQQPKETQIIVDGDESKNIALKPIIKQENDVTINFQNNWAIAEKLCKSSIIPKEFQGKPENVLLCMGMSKKMGFDVITVMNNLQLVMGRQEWKGSFIPVLIEKTGKYCDLEFNFTGKEGSDDWRMLFRSNENKRWKKNKRNNNNYVYG